ncbi:hypothetical protein [Rhizobium sp. Leaf262]|uniref:hypothetical protein n=1 Tax=Rhizobium sp. Leaf262 TaxID=1736312 RepID=UPI000A922ABE|nr:hypothetical protein [Rhizobium sp. Leaf262]
MGYAEEMAKRMPASMVLPSEFCVLFDWMETHGFFMQSGAFPGDRLGLLGSEADLQEDHVTAILFRVATREQARDYGEAWFGTVVPDVEERLVPFARTGGDGSFAAFWLDDEGCQQIVHLGSEGLVCLLGRTPLDFLRLIAIGYEEISGDCLYDPSAPPLKANMNVSYRAWLIDRFDVTVPATASQILGKVPDETTNASDDPFWCWVRKNQTARDDLRVTD